jgi:hypothetical protein
MEEYIYGAFAGTTLAMPNAIEDRREEVGVLVEGGVLRAEIDVLVLRVLGVLAMTGLHSVGLTQHRQKSSYVPREANKRTSSWRVVSRVDVESAKHGRKIYGLMR